MSIIDRETLPSTTYQGHYSWHQRLQGLFYGPGCVKTALPELLETLQIKRAMVLTSRSVLFKVRSMYMRAAFPNIMVGYRQMQQRMSKKSFVSTVPMGPLSTKSSSILLYLASIMLSNYLKRTIAMA